MTNKQKWVDELIKECKKNFKDQNKNDLDTFKGVTKSIVRDALKALDKTWALWELEPDSKNLREQFHLLEHYLAYLIRFCEGKA